MDLCFVFWPFCLIKRIIFYIYAWYLCACHPHPTPDHDIYHYISKGKLIALQNINIFTLIHYSGFQKTKQNIIAYYNTAESAYRGTLNTVTH